MTEKQSNTLVKNPNTKKAMVILKTFAQMEASYKEHEKLAKKASEEIKKAMIEQNITKLDFDFPDIKLSGYITLAERTNYKATDIDEVSEEFLKPALDTDKVKAHYTLKGELPAGVETSKTQYITKKFTVGE